jgi:hypothetical protein
MAMQLLKQGSTMEEAFQQLYNQFIPPPAPVVKLLKRKPAARRKNSAARSSFPDNISVISFPDELLKRVFSTSPKKEETERMPIAHAP